MGGNMRSYSKRLSTRFYTKYCFVNFHKSSFSLLLSGNMKIDKCDIIKTSHVTLEITDLQGTTFTVFARMPPPPILGQPTDHELTDHECLNFLPVHCPPLLFVILTIFHPYTVTFSLARPMSNHDHSYP